MKGSEAFKKTIKKFLITKCFNDPLFAKVYDNPKKNIDECVDYILDEVKKSGVNGFEDDEIFSMALHYYDEADLKVSKSSGSMNVVINHRVELTADEIAKAKQDAIDAVVKEQRDKMLNKNKPKPSLTVVKDADKDIPVTLF